VSVVQPSNANYLSTSYWNGHDIFNIEESGMVENWDQVRLDRKNYDFARASLQEGLGHAAAGNSTEVRYGTNTEFNPPVGHLEDGSLLVIDHETLSQFRTHNFVSNEPSQFPPEAIPTPYSEYWLGNQSIDEPSAPCGHGSVYFYEEQIMYMHFLYWGVLMSLDDSSRAIQYFTFDQARLQPDGTVNYPKPYVEVTSKLPLKKKVRLQGMAVALPIQIGEVLTEDNSLCRALKRIRAIDIIYPASGSQQQKPTRQKRLGSFASSQLSSVNA
jgi:hypothetical protein